MLQTIQSRVFMIALVASSLLIAQFSVTGADINSEEARIQQWHDRGNTWPPKWQLESQEYRSTLEKREEEIMSLTGADERWENFMQFTQGRMVPRFTRLGFEVIQTPDDVQAKMLRALAKSFSNPGLMYDEDSYAGSYNKYPAKIAPSVEVQEEILLQMQSAHEDWAGIRLEPTGAYGIRVNREGSSQAMHYEQIATHVISSLAHVASAYDSPEQPWHLEIEDHRGVVHSIDLQPGQTLLYESASCLHGRREQLHGNYYASLYLHYRPADRNLWDFSIQDVINNVPPHWREGVTEEHGSRHAGQALTIDSMVAEGAPPRTSSTPIDSKRGAEHPFPWPGHSEVFQRTMARREREILSLTGRDERWDNYLVHTQGLLVPRFTSHGFEVQSTPPHIQAQLLAVLKERLRELDSLPDEADGRGTYGPLPAKIIEIPDLAASLHTEMTTLHEDWSGLQLQPTALYGVRVNRNGSALYMHTDKIQTHVISSILHIGHEYDNNEEPWHLEIEDHDGVLHTVALEPGQMLFYESAACLHGRRKVLKGRYYASIFAHYQPVDKSVWDFTAEDIMRNVPAHWAEGVLEEHGSRHAGQGLTIDSRVSEAAPPRVILGQPVSPRVTLPDSDEEL